MAGDVHVAITRAVTNTAMGTQTFTVAWADAGSRTPKAALFIWSFATTDGSAIDGLVHGQGACDASAQWANCVCSEHNVGTTNSAQDRVTDECIIFLDPADGTVEGEAAFSSFGSNTVVVNWGNAMSTARLVTVIAFAGDDLLVDVGSKTITAATDGADTVSGVGFEADLVFVVGHDTTSYPRSNSNCSFGFCVNDAGTPPTQKCVATFNRDNRASSVPRENLGTAYSGGFISTNGSFSQGFEIDNFGSDGFDIIRRIQGGGPNKLVDYLAISTDTLSVWGASLAAPTSEGNLAETGPGFTPQAVMFGMSLVATEGTGFAGGVYGVSVFTADDEFSNTAHEEVGAGTTNTQSLSDNQAVNMPDDDDGATADFLATFVSMDANGFTTNFSAVDSTTRRWWQLAIEEAAAAGGGRIMSSLARSGGLAGLGGIAGAGGGLAA